MCFNNFVSMPAPVGTLRGLSCGRAVCGSHGMKSNEQGSICRSGSAAIVIALGGFAKNRYKLINYLLYFFTF